MRENSSLWKTKKKIGWNIEICCARCKRVSCVMPHVGTATVRFSRFLLQLLLCARSSQIDRQSSEAAELTRNFEFFLYIFFLLSFFPSKQQQQLAWLENVENMKSQSTFKRGAFKTWNFSFRTSSLCIELLFECERRVESFATILSCGNKLVAIWVRKNIYIYLKKIGWERKKFFEKEKTKLQQAASATKKSEMWCKHSRYMKLSVA